MGDRNKRIRRRVGDRAAERGMTLIEIMIVILIMAMIATTVSIAVFSQLEDARLKDARIGACTVKNAVQLYIANHPRKCPSAEDLIQDEVLDKAKGIKDPWDQDYVIECNGREPDVYSRGADEAGSKPIRCEKASEEE